MDSLKAHLLVAAPVLGDENFFRTVVLMISHDEEGALGVVLNRPSDAKFAKPWSDYTGNPCSSSVQIHRGGPVEGPPILLHDDMTHAEIELIPGVSLSTEEFNIDWLLNHPPGNLRVFCGYSGWGPGQLENELEHGGWLVVPATSAHVFSNDEELWKDVAAAIGGQVVFGESRPDMHIDPSMN